VIDNGASPNRARAQRRLLVAGAFATVIFLGLTFKGTVEGDGVGYYSYLHSVIVDHDLDFANEYAAARSAGIFVYPVYETTRTSTGKLANFYPVGPAVLSAPFYLVALAFNPTGAPIFGRPFMLAYTLGSLFFGLLALAICYRITRSVLVTFAVAATTPFIFYLVYSPSYSHTFSAFAACLFVWAWIRGRGPLLLGFLGGLMALVRPQDGLLLGVVLLDIGRLRWRVLLLIPGALLAFAPQLAVDRILYGTWQPMGPPEGFDIWPGHYWQVLLSITRGLFVWQPATLLAVCGYAFVRSWRLRIAMLYSLAVETAINGAVGDWPAGYSFGGRRFLDLLPYFAIGLAALLPRLRPALGWAVTGILAAWNYLLIANLTYIILDHAADPGSLLWTGQLPALLKLPRLFVQGYPVRAIFLGQVVHQSRDLIGGLVTLGVIGGAVCAALLLAIRTGPPPNPFRTSQSGEPAAAHSSPPGAG